MNGRLMPNTLTNGRSDPAYSAALQQASRKTGRLPVVIYDIECEGCPRTFVPTRGSDQFLCPQCLRAGNRS